MIDLLFLMAFTLVLFVTGISVLGIISAMIVGFVVMALAGMIGLVFKLLPWIILIAVVIWLCRGRDSFAVKSREYCRKITERFRKRP